MKRHRLFPILAISLLYAPWVLAQSGSVSSEPISAKERAALFPSQERIEEGKSLAENSCAQCHGIDGISVSDELPSLAGQRIVYLYRELISYQQGRRSNLAMREAVAYLDSEALLNTAIYYASLPPPRNTERVADAEAILAAMDDDPMIAVKSATTGCGSCHGADGNARIPGMPNLTAQSPEFFITVMSEYRSGERLHNMMQTLSASLDDETLANMGLYYALQEPAPTQQTASGHAENGARLAESCSSCHGVDGNVTAEGTPTLAGQDPIYFVQSLKAYGDGQRDHEPMKGAVEGLSESDMQDLAAFYAAKTPQPRVVRKPLTAREWMARCDRCHGVDGNSTDPRHSRLSAQNETYLVKALQAYASGERQDSVMHAMSAPLSRGIIERLAAYYTIQEPTSVVYFEAPCAD